MARPLHNPALRHQLLCPGLRHDEAQIQLIPQAKQKVGCNRHVQYNKSDARIPGVYVYSVYDWLASIDFIAFHYSATCMPGSSMRLSSNYHH